jgi:uncharacterized protein (TIGR02058 family)
MSDPDQVDVDIVVACPGPERVDLEKVKQVLPIGRKSARAVEGGMLADGLSGARFGQDDADIVVANAAVTVYVEA